jgi:hypothetical protein
VPNHLWIRITRLHLPSPPQNLAGGIWIGFRGGKLRGEESERRAESSLFSTRVCFLAENLDLQFEGFGCVETDGKRRRICIL